MITNVNKHVNMVNLRSTISAPAITYLGSKSGSPLHSSILLSVVPGYSVHRGKTPSFTQIFTSISAPIQSYLGSDIIDLRPISAPPGSKLPAKTVEKKTYRNSWVTTSSSVPRLKETPSQVLSSWTSFRW